LRSPSRLDGQTADGAQWTSRTHNLYLKRLLSFSSFLGAPSGIRNGLDAKW
jgi:hypothetical protein